MKKVILLIIPFFLYFPLQTFSHVESETENPPWLSKEGEHEEGHDHEDDGHNHSHDNGDKNGHSHKDDSHEHNDHGTDSQHAHGENDIEHDHGDGDDHNDDGHDHGENDHQNDDGHAHGDDDHDHEYEEVGANLPLLGTFAFINGGFILFGAIRKLSKKRKVGVK